MRIAMFTNTYLPHVGGVAKSVHTFSEQLRSRGHKVLVFAPEFHEAATHDHGVVRVPAIQNFNGSDFSFRLPTIGYVSSAIDAFKPDIIHSHHPFLLGDTALRVARARQLPLVFTHHTLYEQYTHYVTLHSDVIKRLAIQLCTEYSALCDHVIAPSESVAHILLARGVSKPLSVIPTGIDTAQFKTGNGARIREELGIPESAYVVGHVGRLAKEKNLNYLGRAVSSFLRDAPEARFLVVGDGTARNELEDCMAAHGVADRCVFAGKRSGQDLHDAYRAMDLFAFSSHSETQGMVLAEAMSAGLPVVALNASGVREILQDCENGFMLPADAPEGAFANRLRELYQSEELRWRLSRAALKCAADWDQSVSAEKLLHLYKHELEESQAHKKVCFSKWDQIQNRIHVEWTLFLQKTVVASAAFSAAENA